MPPTKKETPSLADLTSKNKAEQHEHSPEVKSVPEDSSKNDSTSEKKHEGIKDREVPAFQPESNMEKMPSLTPITNDHTPQNVDEPPKAPDNDNSNVEDEPVLSKQVVSTVPNKTPADIAAESADETAARYGIDQHVNVEDLDNPNVPAERNSIVNQVPSGTHLHPDIARDMLNRGIAEQTTDIGQVRRNTTVGFVFAPDAENNDKF